MLSGEAGIIQNMLYEQVQAADKQASQLPPENRFSSYAHEKQTAFVTPEEELQRREEAAGAS